jgi:hypothetical protein
VKPAIKLTSRLFVEHAEDIEQILRHAVRHALLMHKRIGNPIATWRDGKVVIIPPEEILVDEPGETLSSDPATQS